MNNLSIEQVTDLETLMQWRMEVLHCVFDIPDDADTSDLARENRDFYLQHLADGSHIGCIASMNGHQVGCGAVCFHDEMPSPDNPNGRCAYLMNIYVRPQYRHKCIGQSIIRWLVGNALGRGIKKVYLETTSDGRPVYQNLGFKDMQDMMKLQ
jgi:N-acetylglutamate synthase-like GNAT family acetyltransferase